MGQKLSETESRNSRTLHIDEASTLEQLMLINQEDMLVAMAVKEVLPTLAKAVDEASKRLAQGGHVYYVGAGTSGRLGVLDASECPPTYGVSQDLFVGLMAGGKDAMFEAKEGEEDSRQSGKSDLEALDLTEKDIVFGLAASGRTPYVLGALDYGNEVGALTISLCCVSSGEISSHATYALEVITGPEAVTGSTRMKAGTAQKMVLNMFSSTLMIKAGKVYENLMVDVRPTNEKLVKRACRIISTCCDISDDQAHAYLLQAKGEVKVAIIMCLAHCTSEEAQSILEKHHGHVAKAMRAYTKC